MKKMITPILFLLVLFALIPVIIQSTEEYNLLTKTETFTATEVLATPEVVTVAETPDSILSVKVNGVALTVTTEYTVSGSAVTILADESEADDVVTVTYNYLEDVPVGVTAIMGIIVTIVLVGALYYFVRQTIYK